MTDTKQNLRAVHAHACAAVMRADRTLTPEVDAFWPIYLRAVLAAPLSCPVVPTSNEDDTDRLDWLEHNATSSSHFDLVTLTFTSKEGFEGRSSLRETIDIARRSDES